MNNLTLRQLRYFDAVARHGHFGRAAEACAVSQPALSMQIKELEDLLGYPVFERSARKVVLTGLGEILAERTQAILCAVDELESLVQVSQRQPTGRVRLGVIPTVGPYFLPSVVQTLTQAYPGLDLHIRETLTLNLIADLRDGRLDIAIVALPVSEPSLFEFPLFSETFLLARPACESTMPAPTPQTLRQKQLLLLQEGHCFREQALAFCGVQARLLSEFKVLEASSLSTLVQMVGVGMGVTLLPEMSVPLEGRNPAIDIVPFNAPQPERTIGMVWRYTHPLRKQFEKLADTIRSAPHSWQADKRITP